MVVKEVSETEKTKFLDFQAKLHHFEEVNPSFAMGWMRVCYHGLNRNGSVIPKETLDAAVPTMFNCPIVANYYRATDSIGSHDKELVIENGKPKLVVATQPVGVVPVNDMSYWEEVEEEDGTVHEYLYTPILLWKRQEAFEHINKAGVVNESMECTFDKFHADETGVTVVDKLTFQAFCLLESAEPCFESASINVLGDAFKEQFSLMAQEWKALCGEENFSIKNFHEQGGEKMEEVKEVVEQPVEEPIEQPVQEEPKAEEPVAEEPVPQEEPAEQNGEPAEQPAEDPAEQGEEQGEFALEEKNEFMLYREKHDKVNEAIPRGEDFDAWLVDLDDEFAYIEVNTWDAACGRNKRETVRRAYAIGEDGNVTFADETEAVTQRWLTAAEAAQIEADKAEADQLRAWHNQYLAEKATTLRDAFSELGAVEGFEDIVAKAEKLELTFEEAQEKLFALKGRHDFALSDKKKSAVVVPVQAETAKGGNRYGGIIAAREN